MSSYGQKDFKQKKIPCLFRTFFSQYYADGLKEDPDIQPEAPVTDIFAVQPDNFLKIPDITSAADLPHTGNAGLEGQTHFVMRIVMTEFF